MYKLVKDGTLFKISGIGSLGVPGGNHVLISVDGYGEDRINAHLKASYLVKFKDPLNSFAHIDISSGGSFWIDKKDIEIL